VCANPIVPQRDEEVKPPRLIHIQINTELADLALELFSTTYGMTWHESFVAAREQLGDLMMYAYEWDEDYYENEMNSEVQP
jgi:hypothetical protein